MKEAYELAGLRVSEVTLRSDRDSHTGELADIRGAVWIDILPRCTLSEALIEEIAWHLAEKHAHDASLEETILITDWKIARAGDRLEVTAREWEDAHYELPRKSGFWSNEHAGDVRPVNGWNT